MSKGPNSIIHAPWPEEVRSDHSAMLSRLLKETGQLTSVDQLVAYALDRSLQLLHAQAGSVFLLDEARNELVLSEVQGLKSRNLLGLREKLGERIAGRVASYRVPAVVQDIRHDPRFQDIPRLGQYRTDSFLSLPLIEDGNLLGVINVTEKASLEPFTEADLDELRFLAEHLVGALRTQLFLQQLRVERDGLAGQVEVTRSALEQSSSQIGKIRQFNESLLESLPFAVLSFDRNLRITYYNHFAADLFALDPADLHRRPVGDLGLEPPGADWPRTLEKVIRVGGIQRFSRVVSARGEKACRLDLTLTPLMDQKGSIFGGLLVAVDIDPQVQIERRVMLSERLALLGKLAATVAHELNNPLDGVQRYVQLAREHLDDTERAGQYLGQARTGLERMARIVSSLLHYARATAPEPGEVDVVPVLHQAIRLLEPLQLEKNCRVELELSSDLPPVSCGHLTGIFVNLIKNAYEAIDPGGRLAIRAQASGGQVRIEFTDDGHGITAENLPRVFDVFFTTKEEGAGLGLAICRDVLERYQGTLSVQSEPGRGATFTVELPPGAPNAPSGLPSGRPTS